VVQAAPPLVHCVCEQVPELHWFEQHSIDDWQAVVAGLQNTGVAQWPFAPQNVEQQSVPVVHSSPRTKQPPSKTPAPPLPPPAPPPALPPAPPLPPLPPVPPPALVLPPPEPPPVPPSVVEGGPQLQAA
jgi:hypothetical protein